MGIDEIRELREVDPERYWRELLDLVEDFPDKVELRVEAAYAFDAAGDGEEAMAHYDAAWKLGIDDGYQPDFSLSYGNLLSSAGRHEEALAILGEANQSHPDYLPLIVILGLALHQAGHHRAAVANLLEAVLTLSSDSDALDGYDAALTTLQRELLSEELDS